MSDTTGISWTDSTQSPWLVCTEKSPACVNCYAKLLAETRHGHIIRNAYKKAGFPDWETMPVWGDKAVRVITRGFWKDAFRMDRSAAKAGVKKKVFPSLMDWLDNMPAGAIDQYGIRQDPVHLLAEFLLVIMQTQNLIWQLLSKRPGDWGDRIEAVLKMIESRPDWESLPITDPAVKLRNWLADWFVLKKPPENIWIGATVEDQTRAHERIPQLLRIPAKIRFLSCEPLLGSLDLRDMCDGAQFYDPLRGRRWHDNPNGPDNSEDYAKIHWIIAGCESGSHRRETPEGAFEFLERQCQAAGTAFFMKQMIINGKVSTDHMEFPAVFHHQAYPA